MAQLTPEVSSLGANSSEYFMNRQVRRSKIPLFGNLKGEGDLLLAFQLRQIKIKMRETLPYLERQLQGPGVRFDHPNS